MRLGTVTLSTTLSALLLSGCSFIGGKPKPYENPYAKHKAAQYGQAAYGQNCQIETPRHPIPRGCRPEQVTIGVKPQAQNYGAPSYAANGFSQQPQFGQPQYTDGAYGSAVGQTPAVAHHTSGPKKRKPKLRGSLSFGLERSIDGDLIDYDNFSVDAVSSYNPQFANEGFASGLDATGDRVLTTYTANERFAGPNYFQPNSYEEAIAPNISFTDAWSTPMKISGGLEYIAGDRTTFFANAGYTHAEGNDDRAASIQATLFRVTETGTYDYIPAVEGQDFVPGTPAVVDPLTGDIISAGTSDTPAVAAVAEQYIRNGTATAASFVPNQEIAQFHYAFSDMNRVDLEAGARHYLKPLVTSEGYRTVTPFVGASAGASHYNKVDVSISQRQRYYQRGFELGDADVTDTTPAQFYDIVEAPTSTRIFDNQWVPTGQLNVGAEWQVTPGAALALESGVRVEGGRKYANGNRADTNITIPVTLRGSVNF